MRKGAIYGTMAGLGSVAIVLAEELPAVPAATAWQIIGLVLVCIGAWVPMFQILRSIH